MSKNNVVEEQYQQYLKLVELSEENMGEVQRTEMRRVFFGAYGMATDKVMELLFNQETTPEAKGAELNSITFEIAKFWAKENLQNPEKLKEDGGFKIIH